MRKTIIFLLLGLQSICAQSLYVHTDKETYLPGEILWFKVYTLNDETHVPIQDKGVAYIHILDQNGNSVMDTKLALENKNAGSLFIPQRLQAGKYTFTASTLGQTGAPFKKSLVILNPFAVVGQVMQERTPSVQFYPESGTLVEGVTSRVAYIAKDGAGQKVSVELYQGELKLSSPFYWNPENGTSLYAIFPGGKRVDLNLPQPLKSGYVLEALSRQTSYAVQVKASKDLAGRSIKLNYGSGKEINLTLNEEGSARTQIEKADLPEGTSLLSLWDAEGLPRAERILFRKPGKMLDLKGNLNKTAAKTREDLSFELGSSNVQQLAQVSISVRKVDSLLTENEENIHSYLYLSKHLKGIVSNSAYYLSKATQEEIEHLLLTQGWRKLNTQKETSEGRYHLIRVRFSDKASGAPIVNQEAYFSVPDQSPMIYTALTNENGIAHFWVKNLYGSRNVATRLASGIPANADLLKHEPELEITEFELPYGGKIPLQAYSEQAISAQVQNVFYAKERSQFQLPASLDSLTIYGKPDARYLLDDYTRFVIMEEVLREFIKEVNVRKNRDDFNLRTLDAPRGNYLSGDPLILLDGIPLKSANEIMNYDPLKVKKIEVIASKYFFGNQIYDGVVSFHTYKGNLDGFQLHPSFTVFSYEGLQPEREFYVPDQKEGTPDQRDVLLWVPQVELQAGKTEQISIKTSDLKGDFIVDIQGIDKEGKSGAQKIRFTVE
jgi:hypothetical protein